MQTSRTMLDWDEYRTDALTQATTGGIVSEVSQNPNAIGYIGFAYVDKSTKVLSLDHGKGPVLPTPQTIRSGEYPLFRTLQIYTDEEPKKVLSQKNSVTLC